MRSPGSTECLHFGEKRHRETDEVFFVQNAGAKNAGTGLKKSAIIEKISLAQAAAVSDKADAVGLVNITTVPSSPMVLNPNGKSPELPQHTLELELTKRYRSYQLSRPTDLHQRRPRR